MEGIQVAAFDCDGVLFDTVRANTAYYNAVLAHFGRPPLTPEQFDYTQMHTADGAIAHLFGDGAAFEAAQAFRREMGYERFIARMEPAVDLKPVLSRLRTRHRTAIATNRSDTMTRVLEVFGLRDYFDLVVTALDVPRPKPHPDQLHRILDHFGVGPGEMLYVGDSLLDQQAAQAAGVPFAAYGNPDLSADFHVDRFTQVEALLGGSR